ncbi:arsenic resistance protein [Paenibacillus massiliensis]|uniref:arsenic resistance protein n=1 Tax=Paenibacillus massiliensis TaxID=225917 RepID=UPI000376F78C
MLAREQLEKHQISIYAGALVLGVGLGLANPAVNSVLESLISPIIALLLYSMFTQIPFLQRKEAFASPRFLIALLLSNFVLVPIVVWAILQCFPTLPVPVLTGICLVLLAPCIDYVIMFTQMARGNVVYILTATPVLFIIQIVLLPVYLYLFLGEQMSGLMQLGPFIEAFVYLIVIPCLLAVLLQAWARRSQNGVRGIAISAWLPVPFMALTLFVVAASQLPKLKGDLHLILQILPIYMLFHVLMPICSSLIARCFRLESGAGRALLFSSSTRNSLVVLPLALALPGEWGTIAAAVIVTQTMVELVAELIYIRAIPWMIKD